MQKTISNIVFTKNRPLQLEAYLESLYRYFPSANIKTHIIYKAELFSQEYGIVFKKYSQCEVIVEKDFHTDFISLMGRINTPYILFGIDDVVYFDFVDFGCIDRVFEQRNDIFGFTFRFSPESARQNHEALQDIAVDDQTVHCLDWTTGQTPHSRYPFELCCTIYKTELVRKILNGSMNNNPIIRRMFSTDSVLIRLLQGTKWRRKILKRFGYVFSPNTLESWFCRWCQNHADRLPHFTYFKKLCASAIQVNMVNTSNNTRFSGIADYSVEALNEQYRKGYRFDVDYVAGNKPGELGCDYKYFKLKKI